MEFGRNEITLNEIDFTLPSDSLETMQILRSAASNGTFNAYIGGTKWGDKSLIGKIYPKGTSSSSFLNLYANNFNTIEFGPTFYMTQPADKVAEWTAQIGHNKDFKFSPKFTQSISHYRRLKNVAEITQEFYDSLAGFGDHLGQLLLQLSEYFSPKSFKELEAYLKTLTHTEKVAIEVRHKDWFGDPVSRASLFDLLRKNHIGTVITDSAGRRDVVHMELTTPVAYIRFVGNALHNTDYVRIDSWIERLKIWKELGLRSVWFYIHQENERHTVELADYVIKKINSNLNLDLKRPAMLSLFE